MQDNCYPVGTYDGATGQLTLGRKVEVVPGRGGHTHEEDVYGHKM